MVRMLHEADVPMDAMETELMARVDTPETVLHRREAARAQPCGTVVVDRESLHGPHSTEFSGGVCPHSSKAA